MKQNIAYVVEWGAISLPISHPSRITCMQVHGRFSDAAAAAEGCEFDARVFPITIPDPATEPGYRPLAEVQPPQKLSELRGLLRADQVAPPVPDYSELLQRIREAVGDPTGKLMQDELVQRIATLNAGAAASAEPVAASGGQDAAPQQPKGKP